MEVCNNNNHLDREKYFCKNCYVIVCQKCKPEHKEHEKSIEKWDKVKQDLHNEFLEYNASVTEKINQLEKNKQENVQLFNEVIQKNYEEEVVSITNQFKTLHDLLHFKEVDLKRELKSYHDQNSESMATLLSKFEHDLEISIEFSHQINSLKDQPPPPVKEKSSSFFNSLIKHKDEEVLDPVLKYFINHQSKIKSNPSEKQKMNSFAQYSMGKDRGVDEINSIQLQKKASIGFIGIQSKNKRGGNCGGDYYIYCFGRDKKFERMLISDGSEKSQPVEKVCDIDGQFPNVISFFWNETFVDGVAYCINSGDLWYLDTKVEKPTWSSIKYPCTAYDLSSCYDGEDHLYVFNGYNAKEERMVKRVNVKTLAIENVVEFQNLSYLSLNVHDNYIYIIGGYSDTQSWKNGIQRLDLRTNTFERMMEHSSHTISGGVYHPEKHAIYFFTWASQFIRYDISTKQETRLTQPPDPQANYSKLYFDGKETIRMIVVNQKNLLYTYDIITDTWVSTKYPFDGIGSSFITVSNFQP